MRLRTLLATTLMLVAAIVQDASAQATTSSPRAKKDANSLNRPPSRPMHSRKKFSRSDVPPPPPIPIRPSRRRASAHKAIGLGLTGIETSGRRDQSGKSVGFYPSIRGKPTAGPRPSASGSKTGSKTPPENPQKDPYKRPG